jgi:hypothetical protein
VNAVVVHLRRHGRIKEPRAAIKPWLGDDDTLRVAIGVIAHDDSVDVILIRNCDDPNEADHGRHWGRQRLGLWRYLPDDVGYNGSHVFFMDGTKPDIEAQDRIERAVKREIEAYMHNDAADLRRKENDG